MGILTKIQKKVEIKIGKSDFERALPVGTSAHEEVFEGIAPAIEQEIALTKLNILGDAGEERLEEAGKESVLYQSCVHYICVTAFLSVLRQLDLVLTPTGFGIVSTQEVSPASKQRVDALDGTLRTRRLQLLGMLLNLLRSPKWGETKQANQSIAYLYDEYTFFLRGKATNLTYQDWNSMLSSIESADEYLRSRISDLQMDEVLRLYRRNETEKVQKLIDKIVRYTDVFASKGMSIANQIALRNVLNIVDSDLDTFNIYAGSSAYKANHHENFQNTKESSAFLFNG